MPAFLRSLLALLLGASPMPDATSPARRTPRARRLRARGADPAQDGAVEAEARSRRHARVSRFTWEGEAILETERGRRVVPGTWTLDLAPARAAARVHTGAQGERFEWPTLDLQHPADWMAQLTQLLTLEVPGTQLRVVRADADGWRELELRAPTSPETVVAIDREALTRVVGGALSLRVRAG